jgi:hypothetical protein
MLRSDRRERVNTDMKRFADITVGAETASRTG